MHVPDGFLTLPTSAATAVVSAGVVALAARRARDELDDRTAPLAGLVATFIFAAQMINFPVGAGTSGHLIGGALAAVLVGPWVATLCLTVVLVVQALLFADGGVSALGTNVLLMGIVAVWVGWGVFRLVSRVMHHSRTGLLVGTGLGAAVSVPFAAVAFAGLFLIGGAAPVPPGLLLTTMGGWHVLIGLGEALITVALVGAVLRTRPDLVRGALTSPDAPTTREEVHA